MIPLNLYKLVHILGIILVFSSFGGLVLHALNALDQFGEPAQLSKDEIALIKKNRAARTPLPETGSLTPAVDPRSGARPARCVGRPVQAVLIPGPAHGG